MMFIKLNEYIIQANEKKKSQPNSGKPLNAAMCIWDGPNNNATFRRSSGIGPSALNVTVLVQGPEISS